MPKSLPHIIWIVVEGNRTFPSYDRYSQNKIFQEAPQDFVKFSNSIVTAPSTLMSTSSFFTGRFAYELYYAHEALREFEGHDSYLDALKKKGYTLNGTFFCKEGNNFYNKKLNIYKDIAQYKSGNEVVYNSFKHIITQKINKKGPNFLYVHIAPATKKDYVEKIINDLKTEGLYDNSFIIISSDHGYTDYGKTHAIGWLKRPRNHSLYVTEDCYKGNFLFHAPQEYSTNTTGVMDAQVSIIDALETIFDYIGLSYNPPNKKAVSLKKTIEERNEEELNKLNTRILRVDNRYIGQNDKHTRIRNNNFELDIDYDKHTLYKRKNNSGSWKQRLEKVSAVVHKDDYQKLLAFYQETNKEAGKTTEKIIREQYLSSVMKEELDQLKGKTLGLYNTSNKQVLSVLKKELEKNHAVKLVGLEELKKTTRGSLAALIILKSNPYFYGLEPIMQECAKKGLSPLTYSMNFSAVQYIPHNTLRYALSDWRAYIGHNKLNKLVIFCVLFYLQFLDFKQLKRARAFETLKN